MALGRIQGLPVQSVEPYCSFWVVDKWKTCYEVIGSSYLRIKGAFSRDTFKILDAINKLLETNQSA